MTQDYSLSSFQISQLLSLVSASPPSTVVLPSIVRLSASMLTTSASSTRKAGLMYFIISAPLPNPPPNGRELRTGVGQFMFQILFPYFFKFPTSHLGATGAFRGTTECGSGPTKGSESPLATEGLGVRGWRGAITSALSCR